MNRVTEMAYKEGLPEIFAGQITGMGVLAEDQEKSVVQNSC
jgi:hypothetical protein